ncbi:MAG: DUF2520 domain-containing protein [Chitinophagia bacterium]|nr:DUF2520 domain-containing protein [Chitinophagia bacterium]
MQAQYEYIFIGSGNIAWYLGSFLPKDRFICKGIYGKSKANAMQLATEVGIANYGHIDEIPLNTPANYLFFLAVTDSAIAEVAKLPALQGKTLIHTSGTTAIDVLSGATANYGVIWCIYSIKKGKILPDTTIPIAYQGSNERVENLLKIVCAVLTTQYIATTYSQRSAMHLMAVFANNFINHIFAINEKIAEGHHVSLELLQPIIRQTLNNRPDEPAHTLQTGPAIRHDDKTIAKHLEMLNDMPYIKDLYQAITLSIQHY